MSSPLVTQNGSMSNQTWRTPGSVAPHTTAPPHDALFTFLLASAPSGRPSSAKAGDDGPREEENVAV
jgi:hypothetical protein